MKTLDLHQELSLAQIMTEAHEYSTHIQELNHYQQIAQKVSQIDPLIQVKYQEQIQQNKQIVISLSQDLLRELQPPHKLADIERLELPISEQIIHLYFSISDYFDSQKSNHKELMIQEVINTLQELTETEN